MKKIFFSMLAVAALASCVKEQTLETLEPAKIGFAGAYVENATKAADPSTTTANINEFYVWGVMDNETGLVFTDETVSRSGSAWTYVNTQYWTPSHNYYFAALAGDRTNDQIVLDFAAAADNGMSVEGLGTMTFTNVSGENDVLYAEQTAETPASVNQQPADVKFQFAHLLSKVKFSFTNGFVNEHNTIVVKNIKMVVPNKGTIDLTQTDNGYVWTGLEGETTLVMGDMDAAAHVTIGETASSDNERLTIPASSSQEYTVTFDVELWMGDVLASSASKTVKINGCALEPGKAYNFKATINQDNVDENPLFPIVFQAEVDEWVEAEYDGGVIATNSVSNEVELQEAINQGGLVTVASDIVLEQPLTIEVVPTRSEGGVATLDLNGKTISYSSDAAASHAMITVNAGSTLIIKDSAEGGKISFEYTGVGDPNMRWGSYTILNEGNVIVESGKVEILCGINDNAERKVYHMYSAIDQGNGSTTINGGVISNPTYRSIRVRKGSLTVNGGVMEGQVWMQANDNNSTITINGGDFSPRGVDGSSVFVTNDTKTVQLNVTGGTFATKIGASNFTKEGVKGTVTGGTFGSIDANLVAEGYFANLIDGKYVVSDVLYATNAEDMATALKANKEEITVVLANDIDLPISSLGQQTGGSGEYKLGGENTKKITIDLNNHKLNITTTYWSNLGAKNDNALFTIKNGTMTSSQATGTWNSYDLCFSNCNYLLEDVVFEKAIALGSANKSFTLNNVTINETHDYYALWIEAVGQTVTVDGLTVKSAGRGIKIDEQYVDAPAKVTLNIANSTFETANKAAILVKSVAGAEINVSDIDITKVAADNDFAVWVDEDAAAYADKVVVNGALCKVEGENISVPENVEQLEEALKAEAKEISVILNEDLTYDVAAWANDAMGGAATEVVTIDLNGKTLTFNNTNSDWNNIVTNGAKLVIKNGHLTNAGYNNGPWNRHDINFGCPVELVNITSDKAFAFKSDATLKNVTINDANDSDTYAIWVQPRGQKVELDGCTIDMIACSDGRGLKIDSQYLSESEIGKVTLKVSNTTFKTEEKAAIIVKSSAGADITLNKVDISEVAADSVNPVWVDANASAYYDLVTVTGGSKKQE